MREKLAKIGAFVAVAGMVLTGRAVELDLAGEWTLSGSNEVGQAISCPIAVPGDVHSALFKAKLMPDPFWGCNETNVQWVGRHDWTMSNSFEVSSELLCHGKVILRLEDCDTFATVFFFSSGMTRCFHAPSILMMPISLRKLPRNAPISFNGFAIMPQSPFGAETMNA